jgi:hypothetical protein
LRLLLALLLALAPASASGQEVGGPAAETDGAAGAAPGEALPAIRASVEAAAPRVGERLFLTLEIDEPAGWKVAPLPEKLDLGPFRVRGVERIPRPDGQAFRLAIVPLQAGDSEIPEIALAAHGPDGRELEVATEPVRITVASNLPEPSGEEQAAPPEPADLKPALSAPRNWVPVIVAVVLLVLAAALAFRLWRKLRRRESREVTEPARREPLRPAWEIAMEELDRIASENYVGRGELKRQYIEVTDALRTYLEHRYGVPALESTTSDLNELLRRAPLPGETSARILSLLREADLVKFAKASPEPSDARASESRARSVVVATMPPELTGGQAA